MHPPARRQHAIRSTVIQSLAVARQMVSPTDVPPGTEEEFGVLRSSANKLHFQARIKVKLEPRSRYAFVLIVTVGEPGCCKCSQHVGSSTGIPVNRERQPEQMPDVALWAVMN